jgi:hypothetical protein
MNPPIDPLARVLESWKIEPASDPNFRPSVAARLAASRTNLNWSAYLRVHAALWAAVGVVLLGAAVWTGRQAGHARNQADRNELLDTYVRRLDPRAMTGPQT